MNTNEFYERLKSLHVGDTKRIVGKLKEAGFDVYATGSSLDSDNYNDIDLLVTPSGEVSEEGTADYKLRLSLILFEHGCQEILDTRRYCRSDISTRFKQVELLGSTEYLGSVVSKRFKPRSFKAPLDVSLSFEPFKLNLEVERVKL